eukprot:scaffold34930_cov225-Skeletonema_marinoi.AAC.1
MLFARLELDACPLTEGKAGRVSKGGEEVLKKGKGKARAGFSKKSADMCLKWNALRPFYLQDARKRAAECELNNRTPAHPHPSHTHTYQAASSKQQAASSKQQAASSKQQAASSKQLCTSTRLLMSCGLESS